MAAAENIQLFCKQRNKRLSLLRKAKKDYLTSLNEKPIIKKKFFWNTVKSFLSNKVQSFERIKFTEKSHTLIANEEAVAMKRFLLKCCN